MPTGQRLTHGKDGNITSIRAPRARIVPTKRGKLVAMHPASRILKQVTLEDSAIAAQVVADLMDESRPEARRDFLAQAARLTDLDV